MYWACYLSSRRVCVGLRGGHGQAIRRRSRRRISVSAPSFMYAPTAKTKEERRDEGMAVLAYEAHRHVVKNRCYFQFCEFRLSHHRTWCACCVKGPRLLALASSRNTQCMVCLENGLVVFVWPAPGQRGGYCALALIGCRCDGSGFLKRLILLSFADVVLEESSLVSSFQVDKGAGKISFFFCSR